MKYIMDQKAIEDTGIEKGIEQVAKEMLKLGTDIDYIMKVKKLTKEKIESLKE